MTNFKQIQLKSVIIWFLQCFHFMKIYYESLYNLIQRNEDFDKICQEVGMCFKNEVSITLSSNGEYIYTYLDWKDSEISLTILFILEMSKPAKEHLLGASKCTYGPSYWCHSSENMNECNVSETEIQFLTTDIFNAIFF